MENILFQTKNISFNHQIQYPDIAIEEEKITFIVGESGCGKSTLLKFLNQTISPTTGEIYYRGKLLTSYNSITLRQQVSLVAQEAYLFEGSVLDNFNKVHHLREKTMPSPKLIKEMAGICCIDTDLNQDTATLSGGEKQRVYIALFLSLFPDVLILDEPTSALDSKNSHRLLTNIINFCKQNKITLIVVSHDLELIQQYHEQMIVLGKEERI